MRILWERYKLHESRFVEVDVIEWHAHEHILDYNKYFLSCDPIAQW